MKHLIATALFTVGSLALSQMGPRRLMDPAAKKGPDAERNNDNVKQYWFETYTDHFDSKGKSDKFKMRYLVNEQYWDPETGPILFYAGNEGDVFSFYDNSGFMTETVAQETKGLIVFGEHRYFGQSYPFEPSVAFTPEHNVYLTVEQVMKDYVDLVGHIRESYNMTDKACVVFGGSYGGMLAAWIRMKYPHVFQGSLAASAPFLEFKNAPSAPEDLYGEICTTDFREQLDKSPELIRESFEALVAADDKTTFDEISDIFNTCTQIQNTTEINFLYQHLMNGYQYMAMTNYPYPASFLEPMPAWPVNEAVKPWIDIPTATEWEQAQSKAHSKTQSSVLPTEGLVWALIRSTLGFLGVGEERAHTMLSTFLPRNLTPVDINKKSEKKLQAAAEGLSDRNKQLLEALQASTSVYFNYTGAYPCTNLSDWEGTGSLDGYGWNVLACNQLAMPISFNDKSMFIPQTFDYDAYTKECQKVFGLTPDYEWALRFFGGYDIDRDFLGDSNTIFSNGQFDPWRAGGLNKNVTADSSGIALYIEGGAHHLDLRPPNAADPATVTEARNIEMANIKKWIAEY